MMKDHIDFEKGYGVEKLENDYFQTRDFTINEVLVEGNYIYCTKQCLLDHARGIIRFTDYEKKDLFYEISAFENGFFVKDKLMVKALRMCANAIIKNKKMEIADKKVYQYLQIKKIHIALHLDRAYQEGGINLAREYVKQLIQNNVIKGDIYEIDDVLKIIIQDSRKVFMFQYLPEDLWDREQKLFINLVEDKQNNEDIEEKYQYLKDEIDKKYYKNKY